MDDGQEEFERLAGACLRRFLHQNGRAALPEPVLGGVCAGIWRTAGRHGHPRALPAGERGAPGEMSAEAVNRLLGQALQGVDWPAPAGDPGTPVRQLLKACLQPEFQECRESYREVINGRCRRQEYAKAAERISGTHCVDCPHWKLPREKHESLLANGWQGDVSEFRRGQEVFLPDDFRALQVFLRGHRRKLQACESNERPKDGGTRDVC